MSIRSLLWLLGFLLCTFVLICAYPVQAQTLPANAKLYLPTLVEVQKDVWPAAPLPSFLGAQVQKESCITVKHPKCWNPHAELKTAREYGFGFGQTTVAYNTNGTERFNVFKEMQASDSVLSKWKWEDRFDAKMQLRALVVKNRIGYERIAGATNRVDHLAFSLAAYNGGMAGVLSDRRLCQARKDCNPDKWFGNVEFYSNKSRVAWHGYGQSAFEINRAYPVAIIFKLRPAYEPYF